MSSLSKTNTRGFTLTEMLLALALGVGVLGMAVQLYSKGMEVSWVVTQKAELQQDARASFNLLTKDISLANAGFSDSPFYVGTALASGGAKVPVYGCDYTGTCH